MSAEYITSSSKKRGRTFDKHNKKSFQPAWKRARDLPAFLDASATVSASTFGSRRLPEIKALWNAATKDVDGNNPSIMSIPTEEPLKSSGGKTSSRHLRRRTTSHKSRKRHRYPAGAPAELLTSPNKEDATDAEVDAATPQSRRSRRKNKSNLCGKHESWRMTNNATMDVVVADPNESITKSETKKAAHWMTTHLWHSKRFHMAALWGWQVPMVHTNRGPKAALRLIREGKTLIQDATWRMAQPMVVESSHDKNGTVVQSSLQRLCPNFQLSSSDQTEELTTGRGMVHDLDQFPLNAIGPITWLVSRQRPLLGGATASDSTTDFYVYFWVEPSIESKVWAEFAKLEAVVQSTDQPFQFGFPSTSVETSNQLSCSGMACLQLRGINATATLQKALAKSVNNSRVGASGAQLAGHQRLLDNNELHTQRPNGTVISVDVVLSQSTTNNAENINKESSLIEGCKALAVSHCICDPTNLPQNAPGIGWDIYCDANIAKELFLALVLTGQACPIGVVEEAYIKLECQPPIASVFPRDFPETELGRKYWRLGSQCDDEDDDKHSAEESPLNNLQTLRLCLEEGEAGGRVAVPTIKQRCRMPTLPQEKKQQLSSKISAQRLYKIHWGELVKSAADADSEDESDDGGEGANQQSEDVVLMRGMFGKPLVDSLSGSGKISMQLTSEEHDNHRRRKRRRVKQANAICHVVALSREEADSHLANCTALLESLSLPAVVACRLQVVGSGTLHPGAQVFSGTGKGDSSLLGYVTAGSFSLARGSSHGIGVLGASRLLQAVIEAASSVQQSHDGLAVVQTQGNKQIHLVVDIKHGTAMPIKATLALLL